MSCRGKMSKLPYRTFQTKEYLLMKVFLIDQFQCLEQFLSKHVKSSSWCNRSSAERWKEFFDSRLFIRGVSEFLKVAQFFFAISSHNAHVDRVFSLISSQWSKERNRLNVETIRHIALIKAQFLQHIVQRISWSNKQQ